MFRYCIITAVFLFFTSCATILNDHHSYTRLASSDTSTRVVCGTDTISLPVVLMKKRGKDSLRITFVSDTCKLSLAYKSRNTPVFFTSYWSMGWLFWTSILFDLTNNRRRGYPENIFIYRSNGILKVSRMMPPHKTKFDIQFIPLQYGFVHFKVNKTTRANSMFNDMSLAFRFYTSDRNFTRLSIMSSKFSSPETDSGTYVNIINDKMELQYGLTSGRWHHAWGLSLQQSWIHEIQRSEIDSGKYSFETLYHGKRLSAGMSITETFRITNIFELKLMYQNALVKFQDKAIGLDFSHSCGLGLLINIPVTRPFEKSHYYLMPDRTTSN